MKNRFSTGLAVIAAVMLSASSCTNHDKDGMDNTANDNNSMNHPEKDQADLAENHNDAKFDRAAEDDAQFAVDAAMLNLREIDASNMAVSRASRAEVKTLAQTMVDDHKKAYEELKDLAGKKNITIPNVLGEDETKESKKLSDETKNFDRKYTAMLVDEHKKAVDKFEKAARDCQDADLRAWAGKMLPALRHHLDMSMTLNDKIKDQD